MNNYFIRENTSMKPCAGCRMPNPALKLEGLPVCEQCFSGHVHFWQNFIESQRVKFGHLTMQGGLTHGPFA